MPILESSDRAPPSFARRERSGVPLGSRQDQTPLQRRLGWREPRESWSSRRRSGGRWHVRWVADQPVTAAAGAEVDVHVACAEGRRRSGLRVLSRSPREIRLRPLDFCRRLPTALFICLFDEASRADLAVQGSCASKAGSHLPAALGSSSGKPARHRRASRQGRLRTACQGPHRKGQRPSLAQSAPSPRRTVTSHRDRPDASEPIRSPSA
jgi:hypothetical protein